VNDYPAMIDQVNHVEPVPQQARARLADEPTGTAPAAAAVHGQAGPPAGGGDLTDELIATDWWTGAMLTAADADELLGHAGQGPGENAAAQEVTDDLAARGFCSRIRPGRSTRQCLRLIRLSLQTGLI
jgi:hypothetical protein